MTEVTENEIPTEIPEGYEPLVRTSAFLNETGPYYFRKSESGFSVALLARQMHTNLGGTVHGGLLATLADIAMGYVASVAQSPPLRMLTVNLSIDFLGEGQCGDWLESHVSISKMGSRLAFVSAVITGNGALIARTSAVFAVVGAKAAKG